MATITNIAAGDAISASRADINNNFANLNSDKIETSVIDTDTTLAANSDAKIPSQKAVKTYVDAGGNVNASTTAKGIVEEATEAEVRSLSAAGGTSARLFMNPSTAGPVFGIKSVTAGATITGATLPVPVYQNKTDNEFYACDGNDTAAMKFLGFAVSNGTDGASMTVQFAGIVSGFSALDEGEKYYLSDTVGTISTTPGTYEVLVGVAISTTEILIQKGKRRIIGGGTVSDSGGANATQDVSSTIGFRPSIIRVFAGNNTGTSASYFGFGSYANGVYSYTKVTASGTSASAYGTSYLLETGTGSGDSTWRITVQTVTDTGFTLRFTQLGISPDPINYTWEAEGEL